MPQKYREAGNHCGIELVKELAGRQRCLYLVPKKTEKESIFVTFGTLCLEKLRCVASRFGPCSLLFFFRYRVVQKLLRTLK